MLLAFFVYTPVAPSETAFITPAGGVSDQGLAFSLAVGFTGNPALSYQWQHSPDNNNDYTNIPSSINSSATNTVLVFSSLTLDESGYYQVVVTNLAGSTVSEVVGLTVLATVPTYAWAYPVSMDTLTANQVLTNFPGTYIAGALVAKNGGQPITVTDAGSDTPIVFAGAGVWASLSGGSGYATGASTNGTPLNNANFNTVLNDFYYDNTTHTITLTGLLPGSNYSVQVFALDDRTETPATSTRTADFVDPNDGNDASVTVTMDANTYVVGTFTAASSVQVIQENLLGTGVGNFNGLVLRAVGWAPPPYFTIEPPVIVNAFGGGAASLYAVAAGDATIASPTISYQWQAGPVGGPYTNLVESAKYVGTQTTNLVVNTLVAGDAAPVYLLAATNGGGTTLSRPAAVNVIIFAAVTPGSYEAYALSNSPAGFWPLNETGDPTTGYLLALDYSGNNLNGTYGVTSETWTNGIFSPQPPAFGGFDANQGALLVAGAGNVSSVVTLPLLNLPAFVTNRSFAMWINPSTQPHTFAALLFNRGGSDGAAGFGFNGSQGNDINGNPSTSLGYTWNDNNGNTYNWNSTLRPPIGQWSFVSLVVNPSNAIVYMYFQDNNGVYHLQSATNNVAPEYGGFSVAARFRSVATPGPAATPTTCLPAAFPRWAFTPVPSAPPS